MSRNDPSHRQVFLPNYPPTIRTGGRQTSVRTIGEEGG